jgi:hypothetical protein
MTEIEKEEAATPIEQAEPASPRLPIYKRHWVHLVIAVIVALLAGVALGGSGSDKEISKSKETISQLRGQVRDANSARDSALAQDSRDKATADAAASDAQRKATETQAKAQRDINAAQARAQAAYKTRLGAVAARELVVAKREKAVTTAENNVQNNTIAGDGLYQVGSDIKPGTYKASAADSGSCYWARLSSINTSNIIDNGNVSGPVVIQVLPSDKALELTGCNDFHKMS